jgi:hypothetical protein
MKYKYPKLSRLVKFTPQEDGVVEVNEYSLGNTFEFTPELVDFFKKLDGKTDPHTIETCLTHEEIDEIIEEYDRYNFWVKRRWISTDYGLFRGIWYPPDTQTVKKIARCWNLLLMILWFPCFVIGCYVATAFISRNGFSSSTVGWLLGLVLHWLLIEIGRGFVGLACGAYVFDMGLIIYGNWIPMPYAVMNVDKIDKRWRRIQCYAAGSETGFLMAGLLFILGALIPSVSNILLSAGATNIMLSAFRLFFLYGYDGNKIIFELIGKDKDDILLCASKLKDKDFRQALKKKGPAGFAYIAIMYIILLLDLLIIVVGGVSILLCFV